MKKKSLITKVLSVLMIAAMVFVFAACGNSGGSAAGNEDASETVDAFDAAIESIEADVLPAEEDGAGADESLDEEDYENIMQKGNLIVGITDFAPMDYQENGEWTGFDAELARKVGQDLGLEVEFMEIDWDNKILELNAGTVDCIWNGMTLTDEVKNAMECTDPYIINEQVVVMAADKIADYPDAESMADLTFAVEAGSAGANAAYDEEFANITEVDTQSKALMEVAAGTSDACVIDSTMAAAMTGEGTSYEDLAVAAELTSEDYGIGFRQGSAMAQVVNNLIDEYAEDGSLSELATKYNLKLAD